MLPEVFLRPHVRVGLGLDQLRRDAEARAGATDAALEHVANVQLPGDRLEVLVGPLEAHRRGPRNHAQRADTRQVGDHFFGQAVGEELVLRIRTQIAERQHDEAFRGSAGGARCLSVFNAAANASAVANRSPGSRASALATASSTAAGISDADARSRGAASVSRRRATSTACRPRNGGEPVSASKRRRRGCRCHFGHRRQRRRLVCSGLMYEGVPTTMPVCVSRPHRQSCRRGRCRSRRPARVRPAAARSRA